MRGVEIYAHIRAHSHIGAHQLRIAVRTVVSDVIHHLGVAKYIGVQRFSATEVHHTLTSFQLVELIEVNLLHSEAIGSQVDNLHSRCVMVQFNGVGRTLVVLVPHNRVSVERKH